MLVKIKIIGHVCIYVSIRFPAETPPYKRFIHNHDYRHAISFLCHYQLSTKIIQTIIKINTCALN